MKSYPTTTLEFGDCFATEERCRHYLARLRWPDGFVCPRCQMTKAWTTRRNLLWCQHCDHQVSVTAGTLFNDTHKPLRIWFEALWYVTNTRYRVSACGLQRLLGLGSYHTAWTWLHKVRRAMVRPGRDRLRGVVQVDELSLGEDRSPKPGRGRAGSTLVVIAAQPTKSGIGRVGFRRVADGTGESLGRAVQEMVEPGTEVRTDGWGGYKGLSALGYRHAVIRQTCDLGDNLLPLLDRTASPLRRWLAESHQGAVQGSHLDYYLSEYAFRFNGGSKSHGLLFYRLIKQAVDVGPVLGASISKSRPGRQRPKRSLT